MGYITREITPRWYLVTTSVQRDGRTIRAAFFSDVRGAAELRCQKWLAIHEPVSNPRTATRPALKLVVDNKTRSRA